MASECTHVLVPTARRTRSCARRLVFIGAILNAITVASQSLTPFECQRNALVYNFSLALQPFRDPSFASALGDALNASECGGFSKGSNPSPAQQPLALRPSSRRVIVDPSGNMPGSVPNINAAMAKVRRWRAQTRDTGVATVELLPGAHRVGVGGLRLDAADSNTALVGRRGPSGAVTAWISGAEPLPDSVTWQPVNVSGGANIWAADVGPWLAAVGADGIPGLRVSGARQTRARYPNADPERDGFGSSLLAKAWLPPAAVPPAEQFSPPSPFRNVTGNYTRFALGVGGGCAVFDPPASFWCSTGRTQSGGSDPFVVPSGVVASRSVLPHSPYADPTAATFNVFRPSHWESYAFSVAGTAPGNTSVYLFGGGGFQGGRGSATGAEFFVEGVLEELDAPGKDDRRGGGGGARSGKGEVCMPAFLVIMPMRLGLVPHTPSSLSQASGTTTRPRSACGSGTTQAAGRPRRVRRPGSRARASKCPLPACL